MLSIVEVVEEWTLVLVQEESAVQRCFKIRLMLTAIHLRSMRRVVQQR